PASSQRFPYTPLFRSLEHLCDALAGSDFKLGNIAEMLPAQRHDRFHLWARQRTSEHSHGALAIDDRRDAELFIHVPGFTEAGDLDRKSTRLNSSHLGI